MTAAVSASVLTIVRGRADHLRALMTGLSQQSAPPGELVIAWMQAEKAEALPALSFPVNHVFVEGDDMPLAAARNRAAQAASGTHLVFLDVDCIPSPTTVEAYTQALTRHDGVMLGEVHYLPGGLPTFAGDIAALERHGVAHPSKPAFPDIGVVEEPDSGQLWGLSFALRKATWMSLGGMDEDFHGYGGEETDLARRASKAGIPTYRVGGARAYHQHHTVHIPPLQHFDHILRNARLYRAKHGVWCMDYWLGQFAERGLIDWTSGAREIRLLRRPDARETDAARQPDHVLFS
ncbi:galactosyltransferase-related protein [Rhizobium sp. NFR03]|uniref:glycosyltransferase family 2 protein n=1 Tax=Rhizobium sp. NFR03 TaxID=1566263 RepID=UPI0008CF4BD0|nr:galactosyltransferase-related protein [Rhizobium sp. NFR03]SES24372.1 Glycosyltransferase, GT2 family [Rhizobium sp. NFR03]